MDIFIIDIFVWVFIGLICCVLIGFYANSKGLSGIGYFFISVLLSPLVGLIIAILSSPNKAIVESREIAASDMKKCPYCAELVKFEAKLCRFCQKELPIQNSSSENDSLLKTEPSLLSFGDIEGEMMKPSQNTPERRVKHHEEYMTYFKFYFYVSVVVGALQIIHGVVLISSSGIGTISLIFSLLEMVWVLFSVVAIFKVKTPKYIPITYVAYNIGGWVYGAYLGVNSANPELLTVPLWLFSIFGLCFGIYFSISSFLAIKQHGAKNA